MIYMKLAKSAHLVSGGIGETLEYMLFPSEHWRPIRTNNPLERIMREIRRSTRVVGNFLGGDSALIPVDLAGLFYWSQFDHLTTGLAALTIEEYREFH